jgi:hypothetical protein
MLPRWKQIICKIFNIPPTRILYGLPCEWKSCAQPARYIAIGYADATQTETPFLRVRVCEVHRGEMEKRYPIISCGLIWLADGGEDIIRSRANLVDNAGKGAASIGAAPTSPGAQARHPFFGNPPQ